MEINIKDLIKNNTVKFDNYRQGFFYYNIIYNPPELFGDMIKYQFSVPLDDIGTSKLLREDKAIIFMRWIRKAIEDKTLIKI